MDLGILRAFKWFAESMPPSLRVSVHNSLFGEMNNVVYSEEFNYKSHLNDFHLFLKDASVAHKKLLQGKVVLTTLPGEEATGGL